MKSKHASQLGALPTLALLLALFGPLVAVVGHFHYRLPEPVLDGTSPSGAPQFSEALARAHVQALEDIGYRIVGTPEHASGRDYVLAEARRLAALCAGVAGLECEVELQRGNGSHRFNILDRDVLKTYSGLTNVLLRISDGSAAAKASTLMLNAHIDSQLPGPGAADDAIGVGIMLDIARVLIERRQPFSNAVLFLWNNAEESLQDASHLFSTQSPWAKSVKAFVNLEAAGTTGAEMLFQGGSDLLIRAYAKTPYPHGTVLAADVFSSGIIGSDTDYGQFEQYLSVAGLDMAIVDNSWYYHTSKDTLANLQAGSTQHFGENVLAIVDELLGPESELAAIDVALPLEQELVYFSLLDKWFFMYSLETARKMSIVVFALLAVLVLNRSDWRAFRAYLLALAGAVGSFVGALVAANLVAVVMWLGLDRSMSWYTSELLPLGLYGPAAFLGMLLPQFLIARAVSPVDRPTLEHATFTAQTLVSSGLMALATYFEVRSGFMLALLTAGSIAGMGLSEVLGIAGKRARAEVHLAGYVVAQFLPAVLGTITSLTVLAIFVPLTGRMGVDVPVELIIANLTALLAVLYAPVALPLFHRFDRPVQTRAVLCLAGATVLAIGVFASRTAFSPTAPRRAFFMHEFNASSNAYSFHLAQMDTAPHAPALFADIHALLDPGLTAPLVLADRSVDNLPISWDSFMPVQQFFLTYSFAVAPPAETGVLPALTVTTLSSSFDEATGVRDVRIRVDHPGLIWPVLAFDAEVVGWPFNAPPLDGHTRHHLKGVSELGFESYELALSVRGPGPIHMQFNALVADGMHPASSLARGANSPGSARLAQVETFLASRAGGEGAVDGLLLSTVVGVVDV